MKKIFALATMALLSGLVTAAAQNAAAPEVKQIGSFQVRCFPVKNVAPCDVFTDRINKNTGQRVLSFSLAYMPSGNRYVLQMTVPLGVSLDKGLVIAGSGYTSPVMPFRRCDANGCYVEIAINRNLIDDFAKLGADAKLRVVPDGAPAPVDIPFSFDGFSSANDDMVASNKAKAVSPEAAAKQ